MSVALERSLDEAEAAQWQPPKSPRPIYDFARDIVLVGGPLSGTKLNPTAERAIDLWLQVLASRKYQWHVLVAPSQRSKTTCGILIPMLHGLIEQRVNVGWVMPNLDKLGQKWAGDVQPSIEAGAFGAYLPSKGPGSKGGRPAAMPIRDPETGRRIASFYAMALGKGGSETSTASNPCAQLLVDEADDAVNAGQLRLVQKRTASYGAAGGGIIVSTVNERTGRDSHPILDLLPETTQTRLAHHCQHCGEYVAIDLECFDPNTATIACPGCGVRWSESDRHAARNAAQYRHKNPDAPEFGVLYVAVDYFWEYPDPTTGKTSSVMKELAREHLSALAAKQRGDPSQWRTYLRKQWCRDDMDGDDEVPSIPELEHAARCQKSPHERGHIPDGCGIVTVGMDTGKRSAWMLGLAMRPDMSWYIVDWSRRLVSGIDREDDRREPTPVEQRDMYEELLSRAGEIGRANAIGVDVGYNTDVVTSWARSHGIRLVRGDQRPTGHKDEDRNRLLPSWAEDRRQDDGSHWLFIDGSAVKTEIAKALARDPGTPGAGHLPRGQAANDWLIQHLTAEVWRDGEWVARRRDNHLLDCLVYAWALAYISMNAPKPTPKRYGKVKAI